MKVRDKDARGRRQVSTLPEMTNLLFWTSANSKNKS